MNMKQYIIIQLLYNEQQYKVNFYIKCNKFKFSFPLRPADISKLKSQSVLLFVYPELGGENSWIHAFPKWISTVWPPKSFMQDLNSGHWVYFQQQYLFACIQLSDTYISILCQRKPEDSENFIRIFTIHYHVQYSKCHKYTIIMATFFLIF